MVSEAIVADSRIITVVGLVIELRLYTLSLTYKVTAILVLAFNSRGLKKRTLTPRVSIYSIKFRWRRC